MVNKIGLVGLGYVGLPLAVEFAKYYEVIGIDNNINRIKELSLFYDHTHEVSKDTLSQLINKKLKISTDISLLQEANLIIITVPTPVKQNKMPDFTYLETASEQVGKILKQGDIVIYESTVYPGATEEICIPILSRESKLLYNEDFFIGYSPERINVGDKNNRLTQVPKIISASSEATLEVLHKIYGTIITAGVYKAPSIKIAEAAKVVENTQRDINIAFVNELAMMFNKMEINTKEVLKAASTKWNFLNFSPGLVGGHCIGIDPYYLAHKSKALGYTPDLLLTAREINEQTPFFIVGEIIKKLNDRNVKLEKVTILILGMAFKENCPDIRNSKVIDIYKELKRFEVNIDIFDPYVSSSNMKESIGIENSISKDNYDVVLLAVAHDSFKEINPFKLLNQKGFVYDIKAFYSGDENYYCL